jgi:glucan phosphoethanolaminetransferase (alkaline phosphatase superfamily)
VVQIDNSDLKRVVQNLGSESTAYYRQFVVWLGLGSGGAATAFIAFATKLPDPSYALHILLPSLWAFLIGIIMAAISVLIASFSSSWAGQHFAEAHNRDELKKAINKMPEILSSPQRIADEANKERNNLINRTNGHHQLAEYAWTRHLFWKRTKDVAVSISAIAFFVGMIWPIGYLTFGGKFVP